MRLVPAFGALLLLHTGASCPPGLSTLYNGWCMRYDGYFSYYQNGFADCAKDGTHYPVITSESDNQRFLKIANEYGNNRQLLLGIVCNLTLNQLQWVDGREFAYMNFETNISFICNSTRFFAVNRATGKWKEVVSGADIADLFCQESRPPQQGNCATHYTPISTGKGDSGLCMRLLPKASMWQDGDNLCYNGDFAHLPTIHSVEVNDFIRRTGVANGYMNGLFLGLRGLDYSQMGWLDGSPIDYNNFEGGFPTAGVGDCGAMDVRSGKWVNTACNDTLPIICMQEVSGATTASPPTCPTNIITTNGTEGTITSPGFPWYSNVPCDLFVEVQEGYRVELEIVFLEANECCDFLELYDGSLGGPLIARLTGSNKPGVVHQTPSSRVMRVSWLPDGAVNVKGFMAKFRAVSD